LLTAVNSEVLRLCVIRLFVLGLFLDEVNKTKAYFLPIKLLKTNERMVGKKLREVIFFIYLRFDWWGIQDEPLGALSLIRLTTLLRLGIASLH